MADAGQAKTGLERTGHGTPGGALDRVTSIFAQGRARLAAMPAGQRRWLGVSTVIVLAVCAGMLWYSGRTDWRILFTGLDGKDVQQIAQELSAAGIAYELTEDGGGVRVASDQVDKARTEVAAKGMPQTGRMGFELFDKPNWVGSEFDEKVNYQRALEGELEHTIATLSAVRSARVHVVMPKDSLFAEGDRAAKASVVLKLRRASMPPEQVDSIRNLVAGAIENLSPEQVTLVDADGRVNLTAPNKNASAADLERGLEEKLVAMLEPAAGQDNVRATVNVSYDESSQERTDEVVDPTQVATLTMQRSEQNTAPAAKAGGVPGTASNTPGPAVPGSLQAAAPASGAAAGAAVPPLLQSGLPVYPQAGGAIQTTKEENGSYAVTRHVTHSEEGPGRVRRVTVAVVVNDRMGTEGAGKSEHAVWKPRSAEEMKRLEQLARAAVGFDATRGDQVVIENVSFSSNVPEAKPAAMEKMMDQAGTLLHAQPGLLKTLSFAAVSLALVIVVLRPMTKSMVSALTGTADSKLLVAGVAAPGAGRAETARTPIAGLRPSDPQGIYEHVAEQIRREPAQSTRLLETWIGAAVEEKL